MFGSLFGLGKQPPPPPPAEEPQLVPGYRMGEKLGAGRLGEVFAAVQIKNGRDVAVKIIRSDLAQDTVIQARFRRLVQLQSKLNHPNLVKVLNFGEAEDGRLYMILERVVGKTLDEKAPLSKAQVAKVVLAAAAALDELHKQRLMHLDVKPSNFFCCDNGDFRLMGLSFSRGELNGQLVARTGPVSGTAAYMAPEQAQNEPNARSDQFALGMSACELLTGSLPVEGSCASVAPEAAAEVLQRMLSPKFEKRFGSAPAAARALAQALEVETN